jgi:hypothetical protein
MMIRHIVLILSLVLLLSVAVQAQSQTASDSRGEFFFGYALNRTFQGSALENAGFENDYGALNLNGFNVQLGLDVVHTNVTDSVGIVGDIGGYFGKRKGADSDDDLRMYSFTIGPQFTNRSHSVLQPFIRALFGVSVIDGNYGAGIEDDTGFGIVTGGGLDIKVHPSVAIRVGQLDYFAARHDSVWIKNLRFAAGLTVLF